jgi:hypothetical protein
MNLMPKSEDGEEGGDFTGDLDDVQIRFGLGEIDTQTCRPVGVAGTCGLFGISMSRRLSGTSNNVRKNAMEVK